MKMGASFEVRKTVKLGVQKSTSALKKELEKVDCEGDENVWDVLDKVSVSPKETEVDLVFVSVAELGLPQSATYKDVKRRGMERGLMPCPNEVAPRLFLEYPEQPINEVLIVIMDPISDQEGVPVVFTLGRNEDDERWFSAGWWEFSVPLNDRNLRFVFVKPRKEVKKS